MGFRAVSAIMHHSQSKGTTRLVALAIAQFYDDRGENGAFPSQEALAKLANVSRRTVQRAITELQELQEIEVFVHRGTGATYDRQTNRYYFVIDCPQGCDRSVNHKDQRAKMDTPTRQLRQTNAPNWADQCVNSDALTVKNNKEHLKAVI